MRFRLGPWQVWPDMDSIIRDGQAYHLSPKAMEVLSCLAKHHGHVVGKEQIFKEVWKETFVSDDSLVRCIGELRRAFQDGADDSLIIRTIPKRGYLLLPPVEWDLKTPSVPEPLGELSGTALPEQVAVSPASQTPIDKRQVHTPGLPTWKGPWLQITVSVVCVAAILAVLIVRQQRRRSAEVPRSIRSLAVLPLANLSGDPEQEYFADGMTEELITELAQLSACDVISRTSVMRYKGTRQPLRDIARELSVDGVVEGTVRRSGTRVRITVQLIDASTDKHLWSGSFEREISDVLSLQAGIARSIAGQLDLKLTSREQDRLAHPRKVVPEAYEAYLRGCYFLDRGQFPKAASYFEQATVADPNFALAYALLFEADGMQTFAQELPLSPRARKAMERARQLDENLAEVHDAAGDVLMMGWNWQAAEAEYRRAVELDPGSVDAAVHYAYCLHMLTRWQEAEQQVKRALRIDPVSTRINHAMLSLLVDTHRYDLAQQQFRKLVELDPTYGGAYYEMVPVYTAMGREADAVEAFLRTETLGGTRGEQVDQLRDAARKGGFGACVRKRIDQLQEQAGRERVSPYALARFYALLGDTDQALQFLELDYRQRSGRLIWIKARAMWDPLRADPRYQTLLRRMRFPE